MKCYCQAQASMEACWQRWVQMPRHQGWLFTVLSCQRLFLIGNINHTCMSHVSESRFQRTMRKKIMTKCWGFLSLLLLLLLFGGKKAARKQQCWVGIMGAYKDGNLQMIITIHRWWIIRNYYIIINNNKENHLVSNVRHPALC